MTNSRYLNEEQLESLPPVSAESQWYHDATVYQIWPHSFADSNGDGIGDIDGIISKLDYLKDLGVDVLWSSPLVKSPMRDMGYDISDYKDVNPYYGTLADLDRLFAELKKRGMKFQFDAVLNHTSNEHAWFVESSKSKDNSKSDWYIWRPAKYVDGKRCPPNNWAAFFSGSAWSWCEARQEYYLCLFCPEQPDLNWENPDVRAAVQDVCRFWLDRGASGFRLDVITMVSKTYNADGSLPDAPVTDPRHEYQSGVEFFVNGPKVHEYIRELHDKVFAHYPHITVGETPFTTDPKTTVGWVHPSRKELQTCFHFDIVNLDCNPQAPLEPREWTLPDLKKTVNKWQTVLHRYGCQNAVYSSNHDQPRAVSRWTDDSPAFRKQAAKMLALHQTTLAGTLYVYQGEELGMKNMPSDWPLEDYQDVMTINYAKDAAELRAAGSTAVPDAKTAQQWASERARDNGRVPMQWTPTESGGFTSPGVKPWMRANTQDALDGWNAQDQAKDSNSVLNFWKRALRVRKEHKAPIIYGAFALLVPEDSNIFAYVRFTDDGSQVLLVILNFSSSERTFTVDADAIERGQAQLPEEHRTVLPAKLGQLDRADRRRLLPSLEDFGDLSQHAQLLLETTEGAFTGWKNNVVQIPAYEGFLFRLRR
ncbi:unnamed protein product [Parajaminaea phylloscopi]